LLIIFQAAMNLDTFFQLLETELKQNKKLSDYHRFANNESLYKFRKSYLVQRYSFMLQHIRKTPAHILDVGCGYGTTAILLTILGHKVRGATLEYYFDEIEHRLEYWSQFADLSNLHIEYADFFDYDSNKLQFDHILAIDTLHHLEPFHLAAQHLFDLLNPNGTLVASEENGNNIIARLKHFRERGFKRIDSYFDERLEKQITFGNENTRSLKKWRKAFAHTPFELDEKSVEYIRFYMPRKHNKIDNRQLIELEHALWKKNAFLREYFFFGFNFVMKKPL
jgi:2-polyprenyl-3-methyl-5-hydroxy-6-metoxy-1,4-benzoquinol methylase